MRWLVIEGLRARLGRPESTVGATRTPKRPYRRPRRRARFMDDRASLEPRILLSTTPGHDYVLSGGSWPNPSLITYSIAPDGVSWDSGTNVLNATWNAKFGSSDVWQAEIARALATWQSVADINIAPVPDSPYSFNTAGQSQSDPRFGDIRFGGYPFADRSSTLAQTYYPPPDGATGAGDVEINTAMNFRIGTGSGSGFSSGYDLFSVLLHETGHSLGLGHARGAAQVMYPVYQGVRAGLSPDDIAGIQAIYGARTLDRYQTQGLGFSTESAIDITSALTVAAKTTIADVWVPFIGTAEYFSFVAPSTTDQAVQVTASAARISMLSPEVSLIDPAGRVLSSSSDPAAWSNTVTAAATGLVAGQRYYVRVSGATADVFSVGAYRLSVNLVNNAQGTNPPVAPAQQTAGPITAPPSGRLQIGPDRFESNDNAAAATWLGRTTQVTIADVNLATAADLDFYRFQPGAGGVYEVSASGVRIQVYTPRGRLVANGVDQLRWRAPRAGAGYLVVVSAPGSVPVSTYSLSIARLGSRRGFHNLARKPPRGGFFQNARVSPSGKSNWPGWARLVEPVGAPIAFIPHRISPPLRRDARTLTPHAARAFERLDRDVVA